MKIEEKQILSIITLFYNKDEKDIKAWYNRRHPHIDTGRLSPKELIEAGKADLVLKWVKLSLDK